MNEKYPFACVFCGAPPDITKVTKFLPFSQWYAKCSVCGFPSREEPKIQGNSRKKVLHLWNSRLDDCLPKLSPCYKCGGVPVVRHNKILRDEKTRKIVARGAEWEIKCFDCDAVFKRWDRFDVYKEWNRTHLIHTSSKFQLHPCPFCGMEPRIEMQFLRGKDYKIIIKCMNENVDEENYCDVSPEITCKNFTDAIKTWNCETAVSKSSEINELGLKICPFCGYYPKIRHYSILCESAELLLTDAGWGCENVHVSVHPIEEAISVWNKRVARRS